MPAIRLFKLTALRANGTPVVGATVRILDAGHNDVTASFFNLGLPIVPVTDSSGLLTKLFALGYGLPVGQTYLIQVIATGYNLWEVGTNTAFDGAADYTANLVRSSSVAADYTIVSQPADYVSALYPIDTSVESGATDLDWELIRFSCLHSDSRSSALEAPVVDGLAEADLHSRVRLRPRPNLVPDGSISLVDPDFSDQVSISFESLNLEGTQSIEGGFLFSAANMVPDQTINDLSHYATGGSDGLIKWITLLKNPVVFRGYYIDVMIWLIVNDAEYTLHTNYFNGAGALLSWTEEGLLGNHLVQRIRLNSVPDTAIRRADLWVSKDEEIISQILTVVYRG